MTPEFPALRESLVRAAARRRRRRLTIRAAVPALAVAAVAVVLVPRDAPDREREAATPRSPLEQSFAVFRRPRNDGDRLPLTVNVEGVADRENARRLAYNGPDSFYAVPTVIRGVQSLCLVRYHRGAGSSQGCSSVLKMLQEREPHGLTVGGFVAFLFADGTRDLQLKTTDGEWLSAFGSVIFHAGDLVRVSWTGPSGTRFYFGMPPQPVSPRQQCPDALGQLPPKATEAASQIALRRAEELYPGVRSAQITAVKRPPGTPCSAAVTRRTLEVDLALYRGRGARKSASLAQGRLLVGVVGGELQVYYLMH